jgi:hypothetical protein
MLLLFAFALLHPLFAVFVFFAAIHAKASLVALLAGLSSVLFGMATTPNVKHTWSTTIKNDSGAAVVADPPIVITADAEVNFSVLIPVGETAEVDAAVDVTKIKSAFVTCTQSADVYTNDSTGSTGQHIVLTVGGAAPVPSVYWHTGMITDCPFTPTITKFFIKNNGSVAATARGGFLLQE